MKRITPRTCLWPITITIIVTFLLSIGLTFRSNHHCYAGTCGEWLFPLQARLHVVVWYLWISLSVAFLGIRSFSPRFREVLRFPLIQRKIPLLDKHLSFSGLLAVAWVCILYGSLVALWWLRLKDYFVERGIHGGVYDGNKRLAAIALTGHVCDVTMGMVLLPISRHSALASFFKLSVSTTLTFHILTAYTLFTLVTTHGLLYVSWLPVFAAMSSAKQRVYPMLNPTYLYHETWPGNTNSLGIWRASLVFTGLFSTVIMILIFITTIPKIRRRHFNLFYFTHLLVIVAVVVICLHASTMFYCTSPGLILWLVDWTLRIYELSSGVEGNVTGIGKGYYVLTMKLPRGRLDGCACTSPLAHFYIYHSESSIRELHPFTTVTHLASEKCRDQSEDITVQFLFRKSSQQTTEPRDSIEDSKGMFTWLLAFLSPKKRPAMQWTEKLAEYLGADDLEVSLPISDNSSRARQSAVDVLGPKHPNPVVNLRLRLEGPYFTPADPYRYDTVICLVAGTGISGGIAIANAFAEAERQRSAPLESATVKRACVAAALNSGWKRCVVIWSVREEDYVNIPLLTAVSNPNLEVQTQLTGNGRPRMDFTATLKSVLPEPRKGSTWVYLSGPNAFITSGEQACVEFGVDYYGARWEI